VAATLHHGRKRVSEKTRAEDERLRNEVGHHFDLEKFKKAIKPVVSSPPKPADADKKREHVN